MISERESLQIREEGTRILAKQIGKSSEFVMVVMEAGATISFAGDSNESSAYLEVKNVGELAPDLTLGLSQALSALIEAELGISKKRIYIEFQESARHLWGCNGKTFG